MNKQYANINDLLADGTPEKLAALATAELDELLKPYYPATRTPVLPPEKAPKQTAQAAMIMEFIKNNQAAFKK